MTYRRNKARDIPEDDNDLRNDMLFALLGSVIVLLAIYSALARTQFGAISRERAPSTAGTAVVPAATPAQAAHELVLEPHHITVSVKGWRVVDIQCRLQDDLGRSLTLSAYGTNEIMTDGIYATIARLPGIYDTNADTHRPPVLVFRFHFMDGRKIDLTSCEVSVVCGKHVSAVQRVEPRDYIPWWPTLTGPLDYELTLRPDVVARFYPRGNPALPPDLRQKLIQGIESKGDDYSIFLPPLGQSSESGWALAVGASGQGLPNGDYIGHPSRDGGLDDAVSFTFEPRSNEKEPPYVEIQP